MAEERVERQFHETIWGAVNQYSTVERAVGEARGVIYALLDGRPGAETVAAHWLDNFGRDAIIERGRQS